MAKMEHKDSILVAVLGLDQPGIVASTAETLTRLDCNIEQMNQTTLRQQFAAFYLVNKPEGLKNENIELELKTAYAAKKFHLTVTIRDFEKPLEGMDFEDGQPFVVSVWGPDRNDIIATFARICAEHQINVESLRAFRIEEGQSLQVFEVRVPDEVDTRILHRIMGERAKAMGLRLNMQHRAIFEAIHRVRVD